MQIQCDNHSFSVPQYIFGTGQKNGEVTPAMFFSLQPLTAKSDFRLYLKGTSPLFHKQPLAEGERILVEDFESVFISTVLLYEKKFVLRYCKNEEPLVSCIYRGVYEFPKKKKASAIKPLARKKPIKKNSKIGQKATSFSKKGAVAI